MLCLQQGHQCLFCGHLVLTNHTSFSCTCQCWHLVENKIPYSLCGTSLCSNHLERGLHCEEVRAYLCLWFWECLLGHQLRRDRMDDTHLNCGFRGFFHLGHQAPTIHVQVLCLGKGLILLGILGLEVWLLLMQTFLQLSFAKHSLIYSSLEFLMIFCLRILIFLMILFSLKT